GMVREGKRVSVKQLFEAGPSGGKLSLAVFEDSLRNQDVGQAPPNLRIAAREHWREERLRLPGLALARADLRQVDTRLHIARQVRDRASIPERGAIGVRHGH